MYISSIEIKDFRAFSESKQLALGKYMTCISGHNGIGKTTILAILSNVGELKREIGRHLNGDMFRGEYSKLIKGDTQFDTIGGEKVKINFSTHDEDEKIDEQTVTFRATFQTHKNKHKEYKPLPDNPELYQQVIKEIPSVRYRLIPQKGGTRGNEKKISWPTYYLGLSRLYPIGESSEVKSKKITINDETRQRLADQYRRILSMSDEVKSTSVMSLGDAKNKKGAGISTDRYSDIGNSSGQDNLGQIILTIESFRKLKDEMNDQYKGGIFLIDELDATLHPAAQIKLYNYLYSQAKKLNLQIVFTTHSLTLVEHVFNVGQLNELNDATRLLYLQNGRGKMEVHDNPDIQLVQSDLRNQIRQQDPSCIQIPILLEDKNARIFLERILNKKTREDFSLQYNESPMSAQQICTLLVAYPENFRNFLVVLDPDMREGREGKNIEKLLADSDFSVSDRSDDYSARRKVLTLPGNMAIEAMLWDYFKNLEQDDHFYSLAECRDLNIMKRTLIEEAEDSRIAGEKQLCFCKRWFEKQGITVRHLLLDTWIDAKEEEVSIFFKSFVKEYNIVAKNLGVPSIFPSAR